MTARSEHTPVAIVGAGQAGLVMSHRLRERGIAHLLLEAATEIGASWAARWDSLRLITPSWMNSLPGAAFEGDVDGFATRAEVVAYLRRYADLVRPDVRFGMQVDAVDATGAPITLEIRGGSSLTADAVVLATGPFRRPIFPAFASALDPRIRQFTSLDYRNPESVLGARVLVVGSGNTGTGIAADLAPHREVLWAMGQTPRFPRRATGAAFNAVMARLGAPPMVSDPEHLALEADLMQWFARLGFYRFERTSPPGERMSALASDPGIDGPGPGPLELGVTPVGRIVGADGGRPVTAEGQVLDPDVVIWATGLHHGLPSVVPAIVDDAGRPVQLQGATNVPGVFVLGLRWLHRLGSGLFFGVAEDAEHLASLIERRLAERQARAGM